MRRMDMPRWPDQAAVHCGTAKARGSEELGSAKPGMRGYLIRDGEPLPISSARRGALRESILKYLLIYGTPEEIPWHVQYHLNAVCSVGRLTLSGPAYISAALTDWQGCTSRSDSVVVWSKIADPKQLAAIDALLAIDLVEHVADSTQYSGPAKR